MFLFEFIFNRGTKVWRGYVSQDLLMMKWYRSRFMATKDIQDTDLSTFLEQFGQEVWLSAVQKLWNYDGEALDSKAY
ncbi:MAG: hypothetical protein H0W49_02040 [Nitrospirales bacterium]|nr:hypothetical protein [Nitrospirales bacterium]MBA3966529.1 hypothetical protein [Nitrospirales bacterium]